MAFNITLAPILLYLLGVWSWPPLLPHYIVFTITALMALHYARRHWSTPRLVLDETGLHCGDFYATDDIYKAEARQGQGESHFPGLEQPRRLPGHRATARRTLPARRVEVKCYPCNRFHLLPISPALLVVTTTWRSGTSAYQVIFRVSSHISNACLLHSRPSAGVLYCISNLIPSVPWTSLFCFCPRHAGYVLYPSLSRSAPILRFWNKLISLFYCSNSNSKK